MNNKFHVKVDTYSHQDLVFKLYEPNFLQKLARTLKLFT